jgi:hypothetical protein
VTLICYRDGILASDSSCWVNGLYVGSVCKLWRLSNGAIWGAAGDADMTGVRALIGEHWPDVPRAELTALGATVNGILIMPDGETWTIDVVLADDDQRIDAVDIVRINAHYLAAGYGHEGALTAMAHGASAAEAVAAAAQHSSFIKLPVQTLALKEATHGKAPKVRKRKKVLKPRKKAR